jgi:hypothetical protein
MARSVTGLGLNLFLPLLEKLCDCLNVAICQNLFIRRDEGAVMYRCRGNNSLISGVTIASMHPNRRWPHSQTGRDIPLVVHGAPFYRAQLWPYSIPREELPAWQAPRRLSLVEAGQ